MAELLDLIVELKYKYQKSFNIEISEDAIETALIILLADDYKFEWHGALLNVNISFETAWNYIKDFDFSTLENQIETATSILPDEYTYLQKVKIKSSGVIWIIHKNDKDPFPSSPHAHYLGRNIKLDLSTGKCYHIRKYVYAITRKELKMIREKAANTFKGELPPLAP